MGFIIIFNIILYLLVFIWTYKNMYTLELKTKAIYITISLILIYIITSILYNFGGNPIGKELGEIASTFNRTMIIIFTGVNAVMVIPQIARILNKYKEKEIDEKQLKKRCIIIFVIFIIAMIFEFNYIKDVQSSMFEMINNK